MRSLETMGSDALGTCGLKYLFLSSQLTQGVRSTLLQGQFGGSVISGLGMSVLDFLVPHYRRG